MGKPRRAGPTKAPAADPLVPPLRKKKKIPKERHCFSGWVLGYSNQDGLGGAIRSVMINSFMIIMETIILTGGNFESRPFSPSVQLLAHTLSIPAAAPSPNFAPSLLLGNGLLLSFLARSPNLLLSDVGAGCRGWATVPVRTRREVGLVKC